MKYCNATRKDVLWLSVDNIHVIKWHVDASFAVHPDFRSHTGGTMTQGSGCGITFSTKQKINSKSQIDLAKHSAVQICTGGYISPIASPIAISPLQFISAFHFSLE